MFRSWSSRPSLALIGACAWAASCSAGQPNRSESDAGSDGGGSDAGYDAPHDAAADVSPDAPAPSDAAADALSPSDAGADGDAGPSCAPQPGELGPAGGAATVDFNPAAPFLQFIPSLDLGELTAASQGRERFVASWDAAPGTREHLDGLGPLAIASACTSCHTSNGRVPSILDGGETGVGVLFRIAVPQGNGFGPDPIYGSQLQSLGVGIPAEGQVRWQSAARPDGLESIEFSPMGLGYGPLAAKAKLGPRLAPQLLGMGLLEAITEADIICREDPADGDGDGVRGRAARLADGSIGRFGWKAVTATLRGQTAAALSGDMGLTTSLFPEESCTALQPDCATQPSGGEPEVIDQDLDHLADFMRVLAVPERRVADATRFAAGAGLFESTGCASCHVPAQRTREDHPIAALAGQTFYPYTDLLLHDMGPELEDGVPEGDATGDEWRTPPLWGLGLGGANQRYLHDGRARSLDEAVRWHAGEGDAARAAYVALSATERALLLEFLESL
ncbi:MAG: thiol oxidoreductase [Myxococcales bacterium]|nr:thiol oxidoreductase [Myxococcales bacterium]